jgi:poly(3-hydroxybutyrate) depolymerase
MGGATGGAGGGGGGGADAVPSAGCGHAPTLKSSPSTTANYNAITVGGVSRRYILRLPANYDNNHPYRLVLSYHWATGSASQVFNCHTESIDCYTTQSPFFGLWDLSGGSTIFIAPDGTSGQAANSGSTNSNYWYNTNGQDVALTDEILKQVEADLCIDTSRIELEGFSMGGAMVNTLVCSHPGAFRAVAAHSAGGQPLPTTCQPIPYFASLGSQESGGQTSTADSFAKTNGCTIQTLATPPSGGHVCSMYPNCSAGHPVRWCPFDGGHTPSPKDSGQGTTWMPKEVWSFFTQY